MTIRPGTMPMLRFSTNSSTSRLVLAPNGRHHSSAIVRWSALIIRSGKLLASKHDLNATLPAFSSTRTLAQVRVEPLSELWFTASFPTSRSSHTKQAGYISSNQVPINSGRNNSTPPDERTLKLGKTLRTLSPLLPNVLKTPLPNNILSSSISLHLFPSTHPHLPVVKGRVPCRAALLTAPVAWGSVPIVGNVQLEIQSEKIIRTGLVSAPTFNNGVKDGMGEEKLVVRWRTERKPSAGNSSVDEPSASTSSPNPNNGVNRGLSTLLGGSQPLFKSSSSESFTGLFVFSFDQDGRIASLTIEHADENHGCDKTSRVVTLAEWLLGRAKWGRSKSEEALIPGLAMESGTLARQITWLRRGGQQGGKDDAAPGRKWP